MERSLRNVLVVSLGFLLLFTAYGGLQNLQSSLYSKEGLGVTALSTLYGGMLLSSMFLPPLLIQKLGCKWTIVLSMCCYVAFSLGNFHASWYHLVCRAHVCDTDLRGSLAFCLASLLLTGTSFLWSHLPSSHPCSQAPFASDVTGTIPEQQLLSCGARDCLMATAPANSTNRPSQELIYTLLGIYTGSGVLAVLLTAVFLEPVKDAQQKSEGEKKAPPFWSTLLSTFKLFRDKRLRLLVLLPLYSGFEQAFLAGDYTRSYTTCALGIQFVGYVMICFAAVNALCSVLYGKLSKFTGRTALFALGAVTHLSCIIALLLWKPHPSQLPLFFVFSGLWGMADAVWQTQNNALFGVLFEKNKEAAFATYRLWEALGFVIAFGYSTFLCVSVKLYILLAVLSLAMAAYGTVEYLEARKAARPLAPGQPRLREEEETQTKM
uniref:Protein unc-93 homolog A n=1 Tax=Sus scrofa TaxID=9823 RepID=A0A8D1F031_PIG